MNFFEAPRSALLLPLLTLLTLFSLFSHPGILWGESAQQAAADEPTQRPDVLLITVDTLRPDALGWVDPSRHTPAFDALAQQGFRFAAAVSPAPLTLPAHTSLFTALVPRRHGVRANGQLLGTTLPTLAETLRSQGYTTAAFVSGFPLISAAGLDRGFDHYDDHFTPGVERPAATTTTAALRFMAQNPRAPTPGPWFLWVHYYDPHDPYNPPAEFRHPGPRGAYDGEVSAVDHAFAQLRSGLDRISQRPRLTVFTADHGESLGEHGEATHGFFLYQSTMAVPLVIHFPGHLAAGESDTAVRLVDVAPTILELLHLPQLADEVDGVGLWPLMRGSAWLQPPAYLESRRPWRSYGWAPLRALQQGFWKLIAAPRPELYDLENDPKEEHNLLTTERTVARNLASLLKTIEERPALQSTSAADAETLARLRSLGYTGGVGEGREPPADAADPKDRIALWNLLGEAEQQLAAGQPKNALEGFDQVLEADPQNPFALARSGAALLALGRAEAAIPRLEQAAKLQPDHAEIHRDLALAFTAARRLDAAINAWLELTRLEPRSAETWALLGNTLGAARQPTKAVDALTRATELAPERPDLHIRLGFAQHAAGQLAASITSLEHAAVLTGPDAFPHAGALGLLLLRQGQLDKARLWLARSKPQEGDFAEARYQAAGLEAAAGNQQAARRYLAEALRVQPAWHRRAAADPTLQPFLP